MSIYSLHQPHTNTILNGLIANISAGMEKYHDLSGDSGIEAYETGADSIILRFKNGTEYLYTYLMPGKVHVEEMKKRAESGDGLNTYLNQHVREKFERRLK